MFAIHRLDHPICNYTIIIWHTNFSFSIAAGERHIQMCNSMNMLDVICPFAKNVTNFHQQLLVSINKFCFSSLKARVMNNVVIKTNLDNFGSLFNDEENIFSDGQIKNWWNPTKWWKPFFSYETMLMETTLDNFGQLWTIFDFAENYFWMETNFNWWKQLWTTLDHFVLMKTTLDNFGQL